MMIWLGVVKGLRGERDKRGSGVRVSSFDPLSLLSTGVPSSPYRCPCSIRTRLSLSMAEAEARARHISLPYPPLGLTAWRATIAIAASPGRLVPLPYFDSPPSFRTVVLVSEPRFAPATVTSLRVV